MNKLILASASPRRESILKQLGFKFTIDIPLEEEQVQAHLSLVEQVKQLATDKAKEVYNKHPEAVLIGADTVILFENEILGKPHTKENAIQMLKRLQDKTHEVITAVAIISKDKESIFYESTEVKFYPMSDEEISDYVDTKEPLDKAGAYTIQEKGAIYIKEIKGDFYTVMGLPLARVYRELKAF